MATERSDKLHGDLRQSTEKFDYFVLGLTGALCAYVSQTYSPARIGLNPSTLELAALLVLVGSAICGFKRIEHSLLAVRLNHKWLRANEERGEIRSKIRSGQLINEQTGELLSPEVANLRIQAASEAIPKLRNEMEAAAIAAGTAYKRRNLLILLGFIALVAAKVWSAYV